LNENDAAEVGLTVGDEINTAIIRRICDIDLSPLKLGGDKSLTGLSGKSRPSMPPPATYRGLYDHLGSATQSSKARDSGLTRKVDR
jgi:hypothetical protein